MKGQRPGRRLLLIQSRYDDVSYGKVRSGQVLNMFLYISYFSKVELTGFDDELDVGREKQRSQG